MLHSNRKGEGIKTEFTSVRVSLETVCRPTVVNQRLPKDRGSKGRKDSSERRMLQQRVRGRWGRFEKVGNSGSLPCDGHRSAWRGCQRRIRNRRRGSNKVQRRWMIKRVKKGESDDGTTGYLVISGVSIQLSREFWAKFWNLKRHSDVFPAVGVKPFISFLREKIHTPVWLDGKSFAGVIKRWVSSYGCLCNLVSAIE